MPRLTGSFRVRHLPSVLAAVVLGISTAAGGGDVGRLRAESLDVPASPFVRGFYMPSYDINALVDESNKAQLDALRAQVASVSHVVLAVHVRVPGGIRSNMVARDGISEDPSHLVPWFDLAKKKGFRVGLIAVLFSDNDWGWGGYWQPTDPAAALASYHSAIQPYLQAAQRAVVDFTLSFCATSGLRCSALRQPFPPSARCWNRREPITAARSASTSTSWRRPISFRASPPCRISSVLPPMSRFPM